MIITYNYSLSIMSNKSDSGSEDTITFNGGSNQIANGEQYDEDICRDYMRNVCSRGRRCRYRHPTLDDRPEPPPRRDLTFCHDYQNNGCTRPSCKFLHCSRDEEEYFIRTGLLPSRLNYANVVSISHGPLQTDVPICRDYLNGDCKRGSLCKYRHSSEKCPGEHDRRCERLYSYVPEIKKRRIEDYEPSRSVIGYMFLEDEIALLKKKVDELKKQVSDLTAINEVLLEQNARFRVSKAAAAIQVPTNHQTLQAVAINAAITPVHAQANLTQLNPSLTQQVALNSDLATQHALAAQRLAAAGGAMAQTRSAQTPMVVTPTVTITQNVAGALALTQSNIAVSMASMPQLQVAHSLTQSLGAPTTTLVSYPIMSHNMRSAVEPSSLTH